MMVNETAFLGECPIIRPEGIYYGGRRVISLDPSLSEVGVGAVQRQNPLPAGRYWVDVFAPDTDTFGAWLSSNKSTVTVRNTEHFDSSPVRDWYLFDVTVPTPWNGPGFPTIATTDVTSSADTVVRPDPPPSVTTQIEQELASLQSSTKTAAWVGVGVLVVVGGALLIYYMPRRAPQSA